MLCFSKIILHKCCSSILWQSTPASDNLVLLRAPFPSLRYWDLATVPINPREPSTAGLATNTDLPSPGNKFAHTKKTITQRALLLGTANCLRSAPRWIFQTAFSPISSSRASTIQPRFQTCLLRPYCQNVRKYICTRQPYFQKRGRWRQNTWRLTFLPFFSLNLD